MHQRTTTTLATLTATITLAVTLSGCTVTTSTSTASSSRTVTPEAFEQVVVDALADISDATPEVDCGEDDIAIEDGAEVHCDVNTAGYDVVYDSVSTISTDGGDEYHVDVEVADQPKG
ncbi:hypothetical protein ITJ50_11820 [Curtobacterium sp. VKM Ac-2889]|jgi:hypothetical protein|uniref:DUF4333 domain-containing protein n=1 Tax=Curtobacterium flaccumfaciens pv. flaccumfaciens TaxID=138532 RepID=A0A9Q2VZY4_9MICO|nr:MULTISPECIES: hypothetical protein [Curtobacterium]MBF4597674.1 hypothetical protein [Curtobacterium sp. VKM Ac-1796]MBF4611906.1 hypothetical protein [Curtobacterium sp. VKM Ac-2889]MBT1540707.1 hypothetical protein [Curtobacterium flaccumfaciens pv. flaccumfaciens]MCS6575359.1 hypothetical protein [Curtobacterium flaccumfaciens pv. flaccumfaciens]